MISIMFGGEAFSSNVAAAPNLSGNTARPPRPKVNASGGEPTTASLSKVLLSLLAGALTYLAGVSIPTTRQEAPQVPPSVLQDTPPAP